MPAGFEGEGRQRMTAARLRAEQPGMRVCIQPVPEVVGEGRRCPVQRLCHASFDVPSRQVEHLYNVIHYLDYVRHYQHDEIICRQQQPKPMALQKTSPDPTKVRYAADQIEPLAAGSNGRDVLDALLRMVERAGLGIGDRLPPEVELAETPGHWAGQSA